MHAKLEVEGIIVYSDPLFGNIEVVQFLLVLFCAVRKCEYVCAIRTGPGFQGALCENSNGAFYLT